MIKPNTLPRGRALLAIAHPGHELRVFRWCELAKPDVAVLTDGSGAAGASRVHRTTSLLAGIGAKPAAFYAPTTDLALYDAVLRGDLDLMLGLVGRLTDVIVSGRYDYVVGDAPEGEIMGHDLFRGLLDAALGVARRATGREIASYDFPLEAAPCSVHPAVATGTYYLHLDDAAVERKINHGLAYEEIAHEVVRAVETHGRDAFAVECLRPSLTEAGLASFTGTPSYERHGERQVAEGRYAEPVRYRQHVAPLLQAIRRESRALSAGLGGAPAKTSAA
ncbi:hypothetical protein KOR34_51360 [Posidoniimonas corsicana]|uniref:Uncharacterized protein n=1 Tax=Posidoniimonas corsicana TaxID=1938618 RepID=A0A5C5UVZ3_9BACT|nr:hypothetical protein [Posidoniimonas corsicana]TWT29582.1 hypothetical protein KOR34_51360 [Posidoniimonas corsicana]